MPEGSLAVQLQRCGENKTKLRGRASAKISIDTATSIDDSKICSPCRFQVHDFHTHRTDRMHAPVKSASPHNRSASVGGRPTALKASRRPRWQHATTTRRRLQGSAAQGSAEHASQTGNATADDAVAAQSRQLASSSSASSVSSTLDSLDALLSSGSIDAEDGQQPGAVPAALMRTLFCTLQS